MFNKDLIHHHNHHLQGGTHTACADSEF